MQTAAVGWCAGPKNCCGGRGMGQEKKNSTGKSPGRPTGLQSHRMACLTLHYLTHWGKRMDLISATEGKIGGKGGKGVGL